MSAVRAFNGAVSNKLSRLPQTFSRVLPSRFSLEESISNFFFSRYELVIANEESEKQVSYKTRHKVYCEEMNFEQKNATELEKDKFDCLPDKLKGLLGQFEFVMNLELRPERVLAQADVEQVIQQLNNDGYYVQFPKDLSKMVQAKSVTDYSLSG